MFENEILGSVGGSGSERSVLLRTILVFRKASAEETHILSENITCTEDSGDLRYCQHCRGVLFQGGALFSDLTVLENFMAPIIENITISMTFIAELASLELKMVGLKETAFQNYPAE